MSKVFVVTRGNYSDYRIVAIFSTRELAQQLVDEFNTDKDHWDTAKVEEFTLDKFAPSNFVWRVTYNDRKDKWDCILKEPRPESGEFNEAFYGSEFGLNVVEVIEYYEHYHYEPKWEPGMNPSWDHKTIGHNPYKEYTVYINEPNRERALKIGMEKIMKKIAEGK